MGWPSLTEAKEPQNLSGQPTIFKPIRLQNHGPRKSLPPVENTPGKKNNLVDVGDETTSNWDHSPEKFPRRTALGIERPAKTSMPSAIRTTIQPLLFQNDLRWGPLV